MLFFQAEDGIRYLTVTGVQTCALPICVARGEVALELRDDRQLRVGGGRVGRRTGRERLRLATGVDIETEVLGELRIELGRPQAEGESLRRSPFQLLLRALDARRARVAHYGKGVLAQKSELEVLPVLPEECTVESQVVVQPACLEADFVVGQIIGFVSGERRQRRRHLDAAIEATGSESPGVGRVEHVIVVDLVGRSEEHTSELQSQSNLVCRLLLAKKKPHSA